MARIAFIARSTLHNQPGGDTVQVEETAAALRQLGHEVTVLLSGEALDRNRYDVIHFFNLGRPADLLRYGKLRLPLVVSPIYVDYGRVARDGMPPVSRWLSRWLSPDGLEYLRTIARSAKGTDRWPGWGYVFRGQKRSCARVLARTDVLLPTTSREAMRLKRIFGRLPDWEVIGLGISEAFAHVQDRDVTKQREGVLCVGRIERRKNTLNLIRAVKGTDIQLTIIGPEARNQRAYVAACYREAGPNVRFVNHVNQRELAHYYTGHRVLAMPSYFETYGLTGIEGLACGCNLVYAGGSDAVEVYEDMALRCDPDDPENIRAVLYRALELPNVLPGSEFTAHYSWQAVARQTEEVYQNLLKT